jgi:DNA (cytosine-5)-methyltransferase 1
MKKYKTVDLFAGAGGLSSGFLDTEKFDIKLAVEYNKFAQKTYVNNHPGVDMESDITKISNDKYKALSEKYGGIDVVIGGPPCQGFSNANRQKNELICGNNQLVKEYIRAVDQLKPKAFVMENVKMISSDKHKFFCDYKNDKKSIEDLGVKIHEEIIPIAKAVILPNDFVKFLNNKQDLENYLLDKKYYAKINTLYKNSKTKDQLRNYIHKHYEKIIKLIDLWDNFNICFWNDQYGKILANTKHELNIFIDNDNNYDNLKQSLCIIIETQKALFKLQEIRKYKIELLDINSDNKNILVKVNTYKVMEFIENKFKSLGYSIKSGILNAADFGVPQNRERFILIGIKDGYLKENKVSLPQPIFKSTKDYYTIKDAIGDLEMYKASTKKESDPIPKDINKVLNLNPLQRYLGKGNSIYNHIITDTREVALNRFKNLKPGQNFHNLDNKLKTTYTSPGRTQNTIYLRLNYSEPSGTVVNVRKSMWIHPVEDRAISVREAARLQSFPDTFIFCGTKDAQYQQVGNAVPPLLGRAIAEKLLELLGDEPVEKLEDIITGKK